MKYFLKLAIVLLAASAFASAAELAILRNGFSIRHERREVIQETTRLYISAAGNDYVDVPTEDIERFEKDASPPPAKLTPATAKGPTVPQLVNQAGDRHLLDSDLLSSIIRAESDFNPHAVSPKGAQGLMQLMPQTASRLGVKDSFDPAANIDGGTRYLRELLGMYNNNLVKALAAYNAGPKRVEHYRGVPPYHETRAYVARVIRDYNRKKTAERKAAVQPGKNGNSRVPRRSETPRPVAAQAPAVTASGAAR